MTNSLDRLDQEMVEQIWSEISHRIARRRRLKRAALIVGASMLVGGAGVGAGAAMASARIDRSPAMSYIDRSGHPQVTQAEVASQATLDSFDARILAIVAPGDRVTPAPIDGEQDGFAGLVNNPSSGSVDLYWSGSVPSSVQSVVNAATDITVREHAVEYSLANAQSALAQAIKQVDASGSGTVVGETIAADAQSIGLTVSASAAGLTETQIRADVSDATPFPVSNITIEAPGDHSQEAHLTPGRFTTP